MAMKRCNNNNTIIKNIQKFQIGNYKAELQKAAIISNPANIV